MQALGPQASHVSNPWRKTVAAVVLTWTWPAVRDADMRRDDVRRLGAALLAKERAALVTPGEAVGTIGATSIGEPSTQGALNVFHFSGIAEKNAMAGAPRFKQLINAAWASDTCNMTWIADSDAEARRVAAVLQRVTLKAVVRGAAVVRADRPTALQRREAAVWAWVGTWMTSLGARAAVTSAARAAHAGDDDGEWAIEFDVSKPAALAAGVDPHAVRDALRGILADAALVIAAESWEAAWTVRVRPVRCDAWNGASRAVCDALSDVLLGSALVKGLPIVADAYASTLAVDAVGANRGMTRIVRPRVGTRGSDLVAAAWLLPRGASARLWTNDVPETAELLGIEAATLLQNSELQRVLSFDSTYVDPRHTLLLSETMTRNGAMAALNRHKMEELGSSLLQRASFEQTLPVLEDAAFFQKRDPLTGSLERQIVGCPLRVGTGLVAIHETRAVHETTVLGPLRRSRGDAVVQPLARRAAAADDAVTIKPLQCASDYSPHVTELLPLLEPVVHRVTPAVAAWRGALDRGAVLQTTLWDGRLTADRFAVLLARVERYYGWDDVDPQWHQSAAVHFDGMRSIVEFDDAELKPRRTHERRAVALSVRAGWVADGATLDARVVLSVPAAPPPSAAPTRVVVRHRKVFRRDGWALVFSKSWAARTQLDAEAAVLTAPPRLDVRLDAVSSDVRLHPCLSVEEQLVAKWWELNK